MTHLNSGEREALKTLGKGGFAPEGIVQQLIKKKLATANPLALTVAGRIVCELLLELERLGRDDDDTRGEY